MLEANKRIRLLSEAQGDGTVNKKSLLGFFYDLGTDYDW